MNKKINKLTSCLAIAYFCDMVHILGEKKLLKQIDSYSDPEERLYLRKLMQIAIEFNSKRKGKKQS